MLRFLILSSLLLGLAYSRQHKSIHQLQWEEHRGFLHKSGPVIDVRPQSLVPLQTANASGLSGRVFGFLPDWEYPGALSNLQYDLLTHIACFDFTVRADGSIANPGGWPWTDLINTAHSKGVKVILTAVNFNADEINGIISDPSIKRAFFNNLKNKIADYSLDGVNIDFEGLHSSDKGAVINSFMSDLTQTIHDAFPGSEVSFDGPAVNWNGSWDLAGLAGACDYIFIMGYAFSGRFSDFSASTAPLTGGNYNISNTVLNQYGTVTQNHPEKLILGVPYYGEKFQTTSVDAHSAVEKYNGAAFYRSSVSGYQSYGAQWDSPTQSPWFRYQSGGKWQQTWLDTDSSISAKFGLARANDLSGIGMWALNYDGAYTDLWNVIRKHFLQGVTPLPAEPYAPYITRGPDNASLMVHFSPVQFAEGYWVYFGRDGLVFNDSLQANINEISIGNLQTDSLYYFKIRAYNSAGKSRATSVLAGQPGDSGAQLLIVDGFDRQSGTYNPRNFIRQHAGLLINRQKGLLSASNEAIENGALSLNDFTYVDWILGDESTADNTFTTQEQQRVQSYLLQGGMLLVSGSEVGWDLVAKGSDGDKAFYQNYLKAQYIADAPNGDAHTFYAFEGLDDTPFRTINGNFDDGTHGTIDVDWPDAIKAINGSTLGLSYKNVSTSAGGAGVYYSGPFGNSNAGAKLVYLAFPLETVYPKSTRETLMSAILNFFDSPSGIDKSFTTLPLTFELLPNVPNPFNPQTEIRFISPQPALVNIDIYNILGQRVRRSAAFAVSAGVGQWRWNGRDARGQFVSAGTYIYHVSFTANGRTVHLQGRMILLK